jgi:fumarylacetoacetate (FAA) hydrolase family protein
MSKISFPLPQDWRDAVLVGRIDMGEGPTPVVVRCGRVFDVSKTAPTVSSLLENWTGVPDGKDLGDINDLGA